MGNCIMCKKSMPQPNPKFYVKCEDCVKKTHEWFFNLTGKTYVGNGRCVKGKR